MPEPAFPPEPELLELLLECCIALLNLEGTLSFSVLALLVVVPPGRVPFNSRVSVGGSGYEFFTLSLALDLVLNLRSGVGVIALIKVDGLTKTMGLNSLIGDCLFLELEEEETGLVLHSWIWILGLLLDSSTLEDFVNA